MNHDNGINLRRAIQMASNRIKATGVLTGKYSFERPAYGYGTETVSIYKITGEDGTVYVWKTTGVLGMQYEVPYGTLGAYLIDSEKEKAWAWRSPSKGDTITFTASVKGISEYKGEEQTELQRVKVTEIISKPEPEHKKREIAPLEAGDQVIKMPYKQYKDHYSDCETVPNSFFRDEHTGDSTIDVVVRAGRLKASGVRGQKFMNYIFTGTENGKAGTYSAWAVCEGNARKQLAKSFPDVSDMVLVRACRRNGKGQTY